MSKELKKLMERFETEVWLYLDGSLLEEEKQFWDDNIVKYPELREYYKSITDTIEFYHSHSYQELPEEEFNRMLNNAVSTNPPVVKIDNYLKRFFDLLFSNNLSTAKVVFAAVLSVVALVILLTTEKPNAVKNISKDILSWRGDEISIQLNNVDESIETLSMEEWEKYQLIQANYDEWEQSYYLLNKEIEQMQKDLGDTSL